jgi:predicted GNAT family acetyltransferase
MALAARDNPVAHRYEELDDDDLVAFTQYRARPGLIAFIHTEVDQQREGEGLGSKLVCFALDDARARQLAVLPFCPFVNGYIRRHREYVDLVPEPYRLRFGL